MTERQIPPTDGSAGPDVISGVLQAQELGKSYTDDVREAPMQIKCSYSAPLFLESAYGQATTLSHPWVRAAICGSCKPHACCTPSSHNAATWL